MADRIKDEWAGGLLWPTLTACWGRPMQTAVAKCFDINADE